MKSPRNTCPRRPAFLWVCAVPPRRPCPQAAAGQLIPLRLGPHVSCGKIGLVPDPSRPVPKCLPQLNPRCHAQGCFQHPSDRGVAGQRSSVLPRERPRGFVTCCTPWDLSQNTSHEMHASFCLHQQDTFPHILREVSCTCTLCDHLEQTQYLSVLFCISLMINALKKILFWSH